MPDRRGSAGTTNRTPDHPRPARAARGTARKAATVIALLFPGLGFGLGACAPDIGDLGRARPSVWNSTLFPAAGSLVAISRSEQVSSFNLTDDESELRDRAWRYLMPAHEMSWFQRHVQELARTRIIPVAWQNTDADRYHAALLSGSFRSEYSRYRRLGEDAVADTVLIAPFCAVAQRVVAADRMRLKVAATSPAISPPVPEEAEARVAENDGMIAWVRERVSYRIANYRHSLDNLLVELPSHEAVMAERAILGLEVEAKRCSALVRGHYKPGPAVQPRHPAITKD